MSWGAKAKSPCGSTNAVLSRAWQGQAEMPISATMASIPFPLIVRRLIVAGLTGFLAPTVLSRSGPLTKGPYNSITHTTMQAIFGRTASAPPLMSPTARAREEAALNFKSAGSDFCQQHPNTATSMWCATCSRYICIRCSHIGHSVMDSVLYFLSKQAPVQHKEEQERFTAMELRNLRQSALWNVTKRQAGGIMRTASYQMDSMHRTLVNARVVLKEAGTVFAKLVHLVCMHADTFPCRISARTAAAKPKPAESSLYASYLLWLADQ